MKILFTGQPRSGKSTLLSQVLSSITNKQGFIAEEILKDGQRVGFQLISADGSQTVLAHLDLKTDFKVGRYFVDVAALDTFIEPLLITQPDQLLYIDEIGQMELASERFKELVHIYLNAENNFIGVISAVYADDMVNEIKARDHIIWVEVTPENRDELQKTVQAIVESFGTVRMLSDSQKGIVEEMAKRYFKQQRLIQVYKLFHNAVEYIVGHKVKMITEAEYVVKGNTDEHRVLNVEGGWFCDCDLFLGKGDFVGKAGECSHIQSAWLVEN